MSGNGNRGYVIGPAPRVNPRLTGGGGAFRAPLFFSPIVAKTNIRRIVTKLSVPSDASILHPEFKEKVRTCDRSAGNDVRVTSYLTDFEVK